MEERSICRSSIFSTIPLQSSVKAESTFSINPLLDEASIGCGKLAFEGYAGHKTTQSDGKKTAPGTFNLSRYRSLAFCIYCGRQVMSMRTGISFLTGIVKSDGGSILKSESVAGIVPVM